jgi:hypothetical protein
MTNPGAPLFEDLQRFIRSHGVEVRLEEMDVETPGAFDGPSITINPVHDREACCYYLAHSFGSIYQWSSDFGRARKAFDDLRAAKKDAGIAFEEALERWRRFEEVSSEHAVWVLGEIGHAAAVDAYTVFFRADLEAMTVFHRTGKEPSWPEFFAAWKEGVARGSIRIEPFRPRAVAPFEPVPIEEQEVVQKRD